MRKREGVERWILGLVWWVLAVTAVQAVITRELPLRHMIDDASYIFTVQVETFEPDNQRMMLVVQHHIKGKAPFNKVPVLLKGDEEAVKGKQTPQLLKRLDMGLQLVLFVRKLDDEYIAFAFTNGTWFQMEGVKPEVADSVRWSFAHLEPYLRRNFKGTTAEMKQTVGEVLQGKRQPPAWDAKEKPGLGPEVESQKKEGASRPIHGGPVFGVIPTVMVGGPLAVLAMLFPTLFGGWKRWLAFLSVVCTTSTIYLLHWWFGGYLSQTVWDNPLVLWLTLTVVMFLGSVWAWVRSVRLVREHRTRQSLPSLVPGTTELTLLILLSLTGLGVLSYGYLSGSNLREVAWMQVLVIGIGAWTACVFAAGVHCCLPRSFPAVSTEVVMLTAMVLASTVLAGLQQGRVAGSFPSQQTGCRVAWTFAIATRGSISSAPLVDGERVYVAVAHEDTFRPFGAVYCLNSATGEQVWTTRGKIKNMRPIAISSPCLAAGRLYVGEGFHEDSLCQLHCLDAETGKLHWQCKTGSHVESSPTVVDGRVYFGAGDDGLYCRDAITGQGIWHFPGLHVDATPLVHDGRVYVGSGVGDLVKETAAVCIDAARGDLIWKQSLDQPSWGSPVHATGLVFFGTGKGRLDVNEPASEGALLALQQEDGKEAWRVPAAAAVLRGAVTDRQRVYFGACDGLISAVDRVSGKVHWKRKVASATFTSPALAMSSKPEETSGVYVLSAEGEVFCLDAGSGEIDWSYNLAEQSGTNLQLLSSPRVELMTNEEGPQRRLYFGATAMGASGRSPLVVCLQERR